MCVLEWNLKCGPCMAQPVLKNKKSFILSLQPFLVSGLERQPPPAWQHSVVAQWKPTTRSGH